MKVHFVLAAISLISAATSAIIVDRSVHRALAESDTVNLIVRMKRDANVLGDFREDVFGSRTSKINALKNKLHLVNSQALAPLSEIFVGPTALGSVSSLQTYWISPVAYIKDATEKTIEQIVALGNLESVRVERIIPLYPAATEYPLGTLDGIEWNIQRIQAHHVWEDQIYGEGVVVCTIDTGVRATHEALKENFVEEYGWFDPELKTSTPHDDNGQGTHTMSTIVGRNGVGVAPGSNWMSCRGCRPHGCLESDLLLCAQWVLCPTDTNGNNPDCSRTPHLVSNSWGGGQGDFWFKDVVDAWIKSGIVPIFASGNAGPACTTVDSPGDYLNVISVGSTTVLDGISHFSGKGPSVNGHTKPDITAPGSHIRAAWNTSDTDYVTISGPSMATPHVAGSVALLLSAEPELSIDGINTRLFTTTDQVGFLSSNLTCGGTSDTVWPNNQYGHGRLNVLSAYRGFRAPPTSAPASTTSDRPSTRASTSTTMTYTPSRSNEIYCNKRIQLWCAWFFSRCKWNREKKQCVAKY